MSASFSFARVAAIIIKEFQQMLRERLTFAMAIGVPVMQLILFGYAINNDPKGLPTALVAYDNGPLARSLVAAIQNTGYFHIVAQPATEVQAERLLETGEVQFVLAIPPDFSRRVVRGEKPAVLVAVDATDPSAASNAIAALGQITPLALAHDLQGALAGLQPREPPFELRIHRRYNPEGLTRYNIVPGLIGTMENLLATPVRPFEVMVGKITPYIIIGYLQLVVIILAAVLLFGVPVVGSFTLLMAVIGLFMLANLGVGFTFSTLATNQLQAMQMTFFFFLPSMLLSGFMFPFRGMPPWAQSLGEILPLTHLLRAVRAIMLKGATFSEIAANLWPMALFLLVVGAIALKRYRQTLD